MLRWILGTEGVDTPTHYTATQVRQMLLKLERKLSEQRPTTETPWIQTTHAEGLSASDVVESIVAAFIYSVDAQDCDCTSLDECAKRQLEDSVGSGPKHRANPKTPANTAVRGGTERTGP